MPRDTQIHSRGYRGPRPSRPVSKPSKPTRAGRKAQRSALSTVSGVRQAQRRKQTYGTPRYTRYRSPKLHPATRAGRRRIARRQITEDSPGWDARTMGNRTGFNRAGTVFFIAGHGFKPGTEGIPVSSALARSINRLVERGKYAPEARVTGPSRLFVPEDHPALWHIEPDPVRQRSRQRTFAYHYTQPRLRGTFGLRLRKPKSKRTYPADLWRLVD